MDGMEELCNDMEKVREEELALVAAEASQQILFKLPDSENAAVHGEGVGKRMLMPSLSLFSPLPPSLSLSLHASLASSQSRNHPLGPFNRLPVRILRRTHDTIALPAACPLPPA